MKKRAPYILIFLFLGIVSCSQDDNAIAEENEEPMDVEPQLVLAKSLGGSGIDDITSIIGTLDGGYALLGFTDSKDGDINDKTREGNDYWVVKLDAQGETQWSRTIGGSGDDIGTEIIQTRDGGYLLTGYSQSDDGDASANQGFHDNWFVKLTSTGEILWEHSYGFSGHDHSYSVVETNDGGYFSAGFLDVTASEGQGNETVNNRHGVGEFWGQRLDTDGNLKWRRYFGGTNNDRAYHVIADTDGGFVMFGFTESTDFDVSNSNGTYDFWAVKVDSNGNLVWKENYGGSGIDRGYAAAVRPEGGFIMVGQSLSNDGDISGNHGNSDIWVVAISANGKLEWQKSMGGSDFDYASSIVTTVDGYIITGNSRSADGDLAENAGENDMWIFKIDLKGDMQWSKTYGGSGLDFATDVVVDAQGRILVTGTVESTDIDGFDFKGGQQDAVLLVFE